MKIKKVEFAEPGMIVLSKGKIRKSGNPYWAYVMIPIDNLEPYTIARNSGSFDLQDFGHIIYWDEGDEPPEDIKKEMVDVYNINENFTEDFLNKLKESKDGRDFIAEVERLVKVHGKKKSTEEN